LFLLTFLAEQTEKRGALCRIRLASEQAEKMSDIRTVDEHVQALVILLTGIVHEECSPWRAGGSDEDVSATDACAMAVRGDDAQRWDRNTPRMASESACVGFTAAARRERSTHLLGP
jgi:hypothetical protein